MTNLVALRGRLSRPAEQRQLESGSTLVGLEVSVRREGEKAETVPVVCFDAPAAVATLDVEDEVVVVGRVRRRFFRAGGMTQSRIEVVADAVVPTRQGKKVEAALAAARERLDEALPAVAKR